MSDVYSSFERDHFAKKSKKRQQDFKSNKKSCRGYKVYEPKSSEKQQLKDRDHPSGQTAIPQTHDDYQDYENYEDYNEYDDYGSKNSGYDKHDKYQSKSHNRQDKRATASSGKHSVWKKEIFKVNKDSILKSHEATPVNKNIDGLVHENSNLFVKEKLSPVNKNRSEPSSDEADKLQLGHKSSGESVASASTNATIDDRKPMETLDFAYNTLNSVKPNKKGFGAQMKEKNVTNDQNTKIDEQGQKENKLFKNSREIRDENQANESLSDKTELNEDVLVKNIGRIGREGEPKNEKGCEETDESEGERYSNIDLIIQRKLLNNEVGSNSDVFDDAGNESKKEEMDGFEDSERPVWEDLETKQALDGIKKEGFTYSTSPQSAKASFMNSQHKGKTKFIRFFGDNEDSDDDFDKIFCEKSFAKSFNRPTVETNMKSDTLGDLASFKDLSTAILSPNSKAVKETPMSATSCSHINMLQQFLEKQGGLTFSQSTLCVQRDNTSQGTKLTNLPFEEEAVPPGFDKPKFVFKYCGYNYDAKIWFYTDERNLIQGPFSAKQMDEWYTNNQLHPEVTISKGMGNNSNFKSLDHFVDRAIQKEMKNLSYDNDCVPCPRPVESGSPILKVEIDPSQQEAQDILAAVDQYSLSIAQEMMTSHNIRETFIEEPAVESDNSFSAQLFAPGRPRQSRRLAAFDACNSRQDLDEEPSHTTQDQTPNLLLKHIKESLGIQVGISNQEQPLLNTSCSPTNNSNVCNSSAANDLPAPAVDVEGLVLAPSSPNAKVEQSDIPSSHPVEDKPILGQPDVPDYRVQPLSATQIELLQNFSWQAFADVGLKSMGVSSAKNE